jgi:hypothetical protein
MSQVKWFLAGLMPAFAAGSAVLANNPKPDFTFWWAVVGAFVGGLAGKQVNTAIDHQKENQS